MSARALTHERLLQLLHYAPATGALTRCAVKGKGRRPGRPAGYVHHTGYCYVSVDRKVYPVGPLVWFYMTGKWPEGEIDHIDQVKANNRWANLRDVSPAVNSQNTWRPRGRNTTGLIGVMVDPARSSFQARITAFGKRHYLGRFDTAQQAHEAYIAEKIRLRRCVEEGAEYVPQRRTS